MSFGFGLTLARTLALIFFAFIANLAAGQNSCAATGSDAFDHSHQEFTEILRQHVKLSGHTSRVDYAALKADDSKLRTYTSHLSRVSPETFETFTRDQRLAFLINAYNAFTLELVLENYPVTSIKDIGGWFSSPWEQKVFRLFNKIASLDSIEHEMIRPVFREPRVHFALVCASKGCPRLSDEAYRAENLSGQLEAATHNFLNDRTRNYYEPEEKTLYLSKIFYWYKQDFVPGVLDFVAPYMSLPTSASFKDDLSLSYVSYDWALNDTSNKET